MIFQEPQSELNPTLNGKQLIEVLNFNRKMNFNEKDYIDVKITIIRCKRIVIHIYSSWGQKQRIMIAMALLCNQNFWWMNNNNIDTTFKKKLLLIKERYKKI